MRYTNALKNQWRANQAWLLVTTLLAGLVIYLVGALAVQSHNVPVRLITQKMDQLDGPVTLSPVLADNKKYLTTLAIGDIQNFTNWTPKNVKDQTARFVNRMTPQLYALQGTLLMNQATTRTSEERSQALFITSTSTNGQAVNITGTLQIWQGSQKVSDLHMKYTIKYALSNGIPRINGFKATAP